MRWEKNGKVTHWVDLQVDVSQFKLFVSPRAMFYLEISWRSPIFEATSALLTLRVRQFFGGLSCVLQEVYSIPGLSSLGATVSTFQLWQLNMFPDTAKSPWGWRGVEIILVENQCFKRNSSCKDFSLTILSFFLSQEMIFFLWFKAQWTLILFLD